jgi:hypothetical protein
MRELLVLQDGAKSVSPLAHGDSFPNPVLKHATPITVILPLDQFSSSIPLEDARVARIGAETKNWKGETER